MPFKCFNCGKMTGSVIELNNRELCRECFDKALREELENADGQEQQVESES